MLGCPSPLAAVTAAAVKSKAPTTHRRRGRKGKSVYRGVCVTREGKWRAVIYKERKQVRPPRRRLAPGMEQGGIWILVYYRRCPELDTF